MADKAVLDRLARDRGFPDYATMIAWQQARARNTASVQATGQTYTPGSQSQSGVGNWWALFRRDPAQAIGRLIPGISGYYTAGDVLDKAKQGQQ